MPAATPIAEFTQIVAAVVIPSTVSPWRRIAPPPRKPMPVTICPATRLVSPTPLVISRDRIVNSAEPTAIRMLVRSPAGF